MEKALLIKGYLNKFYGEVQPPLGLLYISSSLKEVGFKEVYLLEAERCKNELEERIFKIISDFKPDIVGISAITAESISLHKIAYYVKKYNKTIPVVVGGSYPTTTPHYCLNDKNIDFVVIGEGEITIKELIEYLRGHKKIEEVDGIAYRLGEQKKFNKPRELISNIDELPFPDWSIIDFGSYFEFIPQCPFLLGKRYAVILTSRGCPFFCTYCHQVFGKKFRAHTPQRVIEEMMILNSKYNIENIQITDDIFNYDMSRAKKILEMKSKILPNVRLFFANGLRGDMMDDELIELLKISNTKYICLALETGSEKIQKSVKKYLNLKKLRDNARKIKKKRIFINLYVMYNFPQETYRDVVQTIKWLFKISPHTFMPSYLIAYEGTEIASALPEDKVVKPFMDNYNYSTVKNFVNYSCMKPSTLKFLKILSNILFYFSLLRLYNIFRDAPYLNVRLLGLFIKKFITRTFIPR